MDVVGKQLHVKENSGSTLERAGKGRKGRLEGEGAFS